MCLFHQIAREIVSLLVNYLHEKPSQRVKTDKILKEFRLFAICNLHSCHNFAHVLYMKMHLILANQKHIIFLVHY